MSISRPVSQSHNPTFYSQNKRNDYHVLLRVESLPHHSFPTAVKLHQLTLSSYSWVVYHPPLNASFQHSPTYREILILTPFKKMAITTQHLLCISHPLSLVLSTTKADFVLFILQMIKVSMRKIKELAQGDKVS